VAPFFLYDRSLKINIRCGFVSQLYNRHMIYRPVPDYHMHTPRCNHATGTVMEYAQAAITAGLREIGMSDHSPMPDDFDKPWRMDRSELSDYLSEVEQARVSVKEKLDIRVGLEADFHRGPEAYVAAMIASYDWDYVIGSVHYIGAWGFDNPDTNPDLGYLED